MIAVGSRESYRFERAVSFMKVIRVGFGASRRAPYWGFSLEVKKWATAHFLLVRRIPWL
jgi:hypothetical protein|tara:strand:+ start:96 stop:272 length:177 start_codon:yes stop_codon:yes gene_type:complete